jgi:hypothetical protein
VSERQVRRWAVAEGWKERLQTTQRKALAKLEEKHADRLARLALRHQRGARKLRRYALGLLKTGAVEVDPTSGQAHKLMKRDPATGEMKAAGLSYRPLLPHEVNQAALAYNKAAELEYGRAGGKTAGAKIDQRFPDLIALITKINAERVAMSKFKSAGSGLTHDPHHPTNDSRDRALKVSGEKAPGFADG